MPWRSNKYYRFLCVCVWGGGAWARACACALVALLIQHGTLIRLRPLWLHHICRHFDMNGTIFGKKLLNIKCVFWFSVQLLLETFLILRRIQRDIVINVQMSSCKVPVIFVFNKTLIFRQIFEKVSDIKFNQNPSNGDRGIPCGRTGIQTWRR
jgi:hypothetical protein